MLLTKIWTADLIHFSLLGHLGLSPPQLVELPTSIAEATEQSVSEKAGLGFIQRQTKHIHDRETK